MPYITTQQQNTGSFVPTTNVWDIARLYEVEISSPEFKELLVRLYQNINTIALALNTKRSAFFVEQEFVNGAVYATIPSSAPNTEPIQGWNKFVILGPLGAGVTSVPHGIVFTSTYKMISIIGAASNTATLTYYPITYAGGGANDIRVTVDSTNVVVTNGSGVTFDYAYVTLEYIKS